MIRKILMFSINMLHLDCLSKLLEEILVLQNHRFSRELEENLTKI